MPLLGEGRRLEDHWRVGINGSVLLVLLGALAWASGQPFLFPSLGPSAFLLTVHDNTPETDPRRVVGGHAVGVVAGLLSYHLVAGGIALSTAAAPFSLAALRLSASGVLSVGLTMAGMVYADVEHAPACATTLIVSLGLLSTLVDGVIIVAAVAMLVAVERGLLRLEGVGLSSLSREWRWPRR